MEITTIEIRKLTASEGMYLTNGYIYGKEIYLGVNDSPHNWREVSAEEYEAIMATKEANAETELM